MDLGFGNTTSFKSEKTKEEENAYKNDDMQEQVDKLKSKNFIGYFIFWIEWTFPPPPLKSNDKF